MHFSSVVLPEPLCPMSPSDEPCCTSNATSRSAQKSSALEREESTRAFSEVGLSRNSLNFFETSWTSIAAVTAPPRSRPTGRRTGPTCSA